MKQHARPISGPGTTVEIDESKFGKMKYHKGRYIEGQWVFGGIFCKTKACFLVPVGAGIKRHSCQLSALKYCLEHA